jgi:hypothetical protein
MMALFSSRKFTHFEKGGQGGFDAESWKSAIIGMKDEG